MAGGISDSGITLFLAPVIDVRHMVICETESSIFNLHLQASPSDPENFPFVVVGNKVDVDGGNGRVVRWLSLWLTMRPERSISELCILIIVLVIPLSNRASVSCVESSGFREEGESMVCF